MALDILCQIVSKLSESAVILVAMATGMCETLYRSSRNAESFRIKRRAFRLVPPDGGLLVMFLRVNLLHYRTSGTT